MPHFRVLISTSLPWVCTYLCMCTHTVVFSCTYEGKIVCTYIHKFIKFDCSVLESKRTNLAFIALLVYESMWCVHACAYINAVKMWQERNEYTLIYSWVWQCRVFIKLETQVLPGIFYEKCFEQLVFPNANAHMV